MSDSSKAARKLAMELRDRASKELIVRKYLVDQSERVADALEAKDALISELVEALKDNLDRFVAAFPSAASYEPIVKGYAVISKAQSSPPESNE